jgi:thimet oligopeptidase
VDALQSADTRRYAHLEPLSSNHSYASFPHLADYSSDYYTYLWDQVIVEDFYEQFDSKDPTSGDTPMRYRSTVRTAQMSCSGRNAARSNPTESRNGNH